MNIRFNKDSECNKECKELILTCTEKFCLAVAIRQHLDDTVNCGVSCRCLMIAEYENESEK